MAGLDTPAMHCYFNHMTLQIFEKDKASKFGWQDCVIEKVFLTGDVQVRTHDDLIYFVHKNELREV